ncbi:hypothetical protein D1AOALGA4SA_2016 [Olavius algarvensis Delta 1 endosymbiont]|nr:hypothetical protein D1AOALGA4SA_2016 [Olavius algarvensis Delta 1 endosymbiont]
MKIEDLWCRFRLRPAVPRDYDPTSRSVYYITIDRLTKKLTPKFIFGNVCRLRVYKEAEKIFAHFVQN